MSDATSHPEAPLLLKISEGAKKLNLSKRFLEELISCRERPIVRFGKRAVCIRPNDLTAFADRKAVV